MSKNKQIKQQPQQQPQQPTQKLNQIIFDIKDLKTFKSQYFDGFRFDHQIKDIKITMKNGDIFKNFGYKNTFKNNKIVNTTITLSHKK